MHSELDECARQAARTTASPKTTARSTSPALDGLRRAHGRRPRGRDARRGARRGRAGDGRRRLPAAPARAPRRRDRRHQPGRASIASARRSSACGTTRRSRTSSAGTGPAPLIEVGGEALQARPRRAEIEGDGAELVTGAAARALQGDGAFRDRLRSARARRRRPRRPTGPPIRTSRRSIPRTDTRRKPAPHPRRGAERQARPREARAGRAGEGGGAAGRRCTRSSPATRRSRPTAWRTKRSGRGPRPPSSPPTTRVTRRRSRRSVRFAWSKKALFAFFDSRLRRLPHRHLEADRGGARGPLQGGLRRDLPHARRGASRSTTTRSSSARSGTSSTSTSIARRARATPSGRAARRSARVRDASTHTAAIEVALTAADVTGALTPGAHLPLGLYRIEGTGERQYLAWSPPKTPKPNFHVPEAFGSLVLDPSVALNPVLGVRVARARPSVVSPIPFFRETLAARHGGSAASKRVRRGARPRLFPRPRCTNSSNSSFTSTNT